MTETEEIRKAALDFAISYCRPNSAVVSAMTSESVLETAEQFARFIAHGVHLDRKKIVHGLGGTSIKVPAGA